MKKLSCRIASTFWLMGISWEADCLKSNALYRSDAVGLSVSQDRISFTPVSKSLVFPVIFIFIFCLLLPSPPPTPRPPALDICSGKHVLRKCIGALCGVRLLPLASQFVPREPWQGQGLRDRPGT